MMTPPLSSLLLASPVAPIGVQHVTTDSLNDYYSPNNLAAQMAFRRMADSYTSDRDGGKAISQGIGTFLATQVALKFVQGYSKGIRQYAETHPRFDDFRNRHPIIAGLMTWGPVLPLTGGLMLGGEALFQKVLGGKSASMANRMLKIPGVAPLAIGAFVVGAIGTSFWGIFAKNSVESAADFGRRYREASREHPDLQPAQLHQWVKAERNQAFENNLLGSHRADLDPFYGVKPYALPSGQ